MSVAPLLLGGVLGLGVLLSWQGFRTVTDRRLDEVDRRKGFWRLSAGLVLAGASMLAFRYFGAA